MKRIILGLALVLVLPALALAQAKAPASQKLSLEFVDGENLTVVNADKSQLKFNVGIFEGDSIPAGATIITGKDTSAELKLVPNGSIVKLGKGSTFAVLALGGGSSDKNALQVAAGKIKTIAAKGSNITITTPTAIAAVRGTDFVVQIEGGKELLAVKNGLVAFSKIDSIGNALGDALDIGAGMAADALASAFEAFDFPASQYDEEFSDMSFQKLSETDAESAVADGGDAAAATTQVETTPTTAADAAGTVAGGLAKMDQAEVTSGLMKWLQDILGFELGSVTINGTTYSKAIVQPNFNLGKLKFGLYLPVIYASDMFNPSDWYRPAGNDEWSFGTQKDSSGQMLWNSDPVAAALDTAADVALKFKYIEFGKQLDDPFFIKVGNLDSLTIGHGLIMRNYNNNTEFPAVRRVGFNLGLDFGGLGFEALVNDLADPYLYGGRLYLRPFKGSKLAFGVSGAVDVNPAGDFAKAGLPTYGDPMFISGGADIDLPIIKANGIFSIRAFADAAVTLPYLREDFGAVSQGLQTQILVDQSSGSTTFNNWGAAAGFMGNLLFIDYRLEYRYYTGFFQPYFYDSTYDKARSSYVVRFDSYLQDLAAVSTSPSVMGIYGEGGFSFLKEKLSLRLGYAWPWDPALNVADFADFADFVAASPTDEFHAALVVKKGLIPIIDVAGSITYDRRGLVKSLVSSDFRLIDEYTSFAGELVIPVPKTPNLDVAAVFATVPVRNADGSVKYVAGQEAQGIPVLRPSITFETRFHF